MIRLSYLVFLMFFMFINTGCAKSLIVNSNSEILEVSLIGKHKTRSFNIKCDQIFSLHNDKLYYSYNGNVFSYDINNQSAELLFKGHSPLVIDNSDFFISQTLQDGQYLIRVKNGQFSKIVKLPEFGNSLIDGHLTVWPYHEPIPVKISDREYVIIDDKLDIYSYNIDSQTKSLFNKSNYLPLGFIRESSELILIGVKDLQYYLYNIVSGETDRFDIDKKYRFVNYIPENNSIVLQSSKVIDGREAFPLILFELSSNKFIDISENLPVLHAEIIEKCSFDKSLE